VVPTAPTLTTVLPLTTATAVPTLHGHANNYTTRNTNNPTIYRGTTTYSYPDNNPQQGVELVVLTRCSTDIQLLRQKFLQSDLARLLT
jgi:hypothetical protein